MEMLAMGTRLAQEAVMKALLQWIATAVLVVAGVVLLCVPARGQRSSAANAAVLSGVVDGGTEVSPLPSAKGSPAGFVPTRFTVTDAGTVGKPDVVLIPGLASSKAVWDGEVKLLGPNYRLHVVQVGGFAGAPAGPNAGPGMLAGIVEELHGYIVGPLSVGGRRPVVVGHSLGGLLAMMLAARYPGDVRKMVIVDTLPYYAVLFQPGATVESVQPMAAGIRAEMVKMSAEEYAAGEKTMLPGMAISEAGQRAAYESSVASDRAVVAEALYEDLLTDMRPEVGKIQTPTLVLYAYDATAKMPPANAYEGMMQDGYKAMPHVTLVKVDGSRHFMMYDQPGKMDAAMEGWLR
jgi:pimeloyl-ACP methyl ester carboxylesterase